MIFDTVLLPRRRQHSVQSGLWQDKTINDYLGACLENTPQKTALIAYQTGVESPHRFTFADLEIHIQRAAYGLRQLGVQKNDVVACQLPNWWQFTVTYLACARIGAVFNPLMPIFRERELSFMLQHSEAKVIVIPKVFRGFNYAEMLAGLQASLPQLKKVVVIDGDPNSSYAQLLDNPSFDAQAHSLSLVQAPLTADDVTQLIFTSGTTGEPKGVMHTSNTMISNILPYADRMRLSAKDIVLMASPMAHQTGFMYGLLMPLILQSTVVLLDVWVPKVAAELIDRHQVSFTMASTPFLTDLTNEVDRLQQNLPSLKTFLCAGAPILKPLLERARAVLGVKIVSAWGMSENGAVTTTLLEDPDERAFNTDGKPLPGVEIKVVDFDGKELPLHQEGRLLVKSCSNFGGYLKRPHLNATSEDGWLDTGDLAKIDEQGYVRIVGRSKDVIIRGGENIPVIEIETILYGHPAIQLAAVVAYPDERLGERACAYVVLKEGHTLSLEELVSYFKQEKVAMQYIPERLEITEALPMTPSGKIQKFKLRQQLQV